MASGAERSLAGGSSNAQAAGPVVAPRPRPRPTHQLQPSASTPSGSGSRPGAPLTAAPPKHHASAPAAAGSHRLILPAGPPPREGIVTNGNVGGMIAAASRNTKVPPKNVHVKGACDACRGRKIKCSGGRPKCAACERSGATCNYIAGPTETHSQALKRKFDQLQEEKSIYEELCGLLGKMPENESLEVVRRLRNGDDVPTILRQVKMGCLLLELALKPETRYRYSFPYVADMPLQLRQPDNPYVGSSIFEASYTGSPSPSPAQLPEGGRCVYMKPYHVSEVVDSRFEKIRARRWTLVTDDDGLFVGLLRAFILYEHTTFPYVHIDSLIDGMVDGDERFCSSLMVNALMASACHCHQGIPERHKFWKPSTLGYQFLSEARRLWELEIKSGVSSLTTVMAGVLLNIEYNHNGMDTLGYTFLSQSVAIAEHIGLFDPRVQQRIEDQKQRECWEYSSWALFSWAAVQAYYFFRHPVVKFIPATPLPDPKKSPSWYGECWLLYPVSPAPISAEHGYTVKSTTELHIILWKISCRAFRDGQSTQKLSWEEAMDFKHQLDHWFHTLPEELSPKKVVFPWHLKLHTTYYSALYTIFNSLVSPSALPSISALSSHPPSSPPPTCAEIASGAIMRLETVIRLYYLRHSFSFSDSFLVYYLSVLARATLSVIEDPQPLLDEQQIRTLRSTVFLCMKGMNEQGRNNYVSEVVFRVLRGLLGDEERAMLERSVELIEWSEDDMFVASQCRSQWPMPGVRVWESPREAGLDVSMDKLVKKAGEMRLREGSDGSERGEREGKRRKGMVNGWGNGSAGGSRGGTGSPSVVGGAQREGTGSPSVGSPGSSAASTRGPGWRVIELN